MWLGVVLTLVGVLGFVPGIAPGGQLLGVFMVDSLHNVVHLLTGILGLLLAKSAGKAYLKGLGVVYLVVTVLGFAQGSVLGLIMVNTADNVLHLVLAALGLYYGFGKRENVA